MNFVERIAYLKKQEGVIKEEVEGLVSVLGCDDWAFCVHVHYDESRVSMWRRSGSIDEDVILIVKGGCAKVHSGSMCRSDWQEAEDILNACLAQDFSEDVKGGCRVNAEGEGGWGELEHKAEEAK